MGGTALFARTRSNWPLLHQEMTSDVLLFEGMTESGIDEVIVRVDSRTIGPLRNLGDPCIDVRCNRKFANIPQVETDDRRVAEPAFEHPSGIAASAVSPSVVFSSPTFLDARLCFFPDLLAEVGCRLSIYETPGKRDATLSSLESPGPLVSNQCRSGCGRSRSPRAVRLQRHPRPASLERVPRPGPFRSVRLGRDRRR